MIIQAKQPRDLVLLLLLLFFILDLYIFLISGFKHVFKQGKGEASTSKSGKPR